MIAEKTGVNAGKLWDLLNDQGELSFKDVKKKLKLTNPELHMAMGWLSREDKLAVSDLTEMKMTLKG